MTSQDAPLVRVFFIQKFVMNCAVSTGAAFHSNRATAYDFFPDRNTIAVRPDKSAVLM